MEVEASAPGKLFLLGEYAVALGGPAIVAAVDRRVRCRARLRRGDGELHVSTPSGRWTGSLFPDDLASVPQECRFAAGAASAAARRIGGWGDRDLHLETRSEFDGRGPKVGLGGSAAAVAAVLAATYRLSGRLDDTAGERAALGVLVHRHVQGSGSGADVVASTLGGVRRIRGLLPKPPPERLPSNPSDLAFETEALTLPADAEMAVVATGRAARTGPRVTRFVEAASGQRGRAAAVVLEAWCAGMATGVDVLGEACRAQTARPARAALELGRVLFERLGALAGIRVWTPALRAACMALRGEGVSAKPSGAGGGDCAIALVSAARRMELREAWLRRDLDPLDLAVDPDGARVDLVREEE